MSKYRVFLSEDLEVVACEVEIEIGIGIASLPDKMS